MGSLATVQVWRPEGNIRWCLIKLHTFKKFYFMCIYVYVNVHMCAGDHRGQKGVLDSLELEL